jgi:hypothetical protein
MHSALSSGSFSATQLPLFMNRNFSDNGRISLIKVSVLFYWHGLIVSRLKT